MFFDSSLPLWLSQASHPLPRWDKASKLMAASALYLLRLECRRLDFGPPGCRPRPIFPARKGSSEKYSKLRPAEGERFRLTPGPKRT
jgi:hypothetical protein